MISGRLLKFADESTEETVMEAIQGQKLRCLAQRKLRVYLTGMLRERRRDITHFEELGRRRGFQRVELEL